MADNSEGNTGGSKVGTTDGPSNLNKLGAAEGWADSEEGLLESNKVGVAEGVLDNAEGKTVGSKVGATDAPFVGILLETIDGALLDVTDCLRVGMLLGTSVGEKEK